MVLLQGLIFGRALMDSLARRGGVAPIAGAMHLQRKKTHRRSMASHQGLPRSTNPYEFNEMLQRSGGCSIRHLSSKTVTASLESSQNLEELLKDEVWIPVYRFRGIYLSVLIAKIKLAITLSSLTVIPFKYWQYIQDDISGNQFLSFTAFASFTTLALILFSRVFNRLIGVISMNETNEYVRIGYLSFWGSRRNKFVETEDIVPLNELSTGTNSKILKLRQYSANDHLNLPTFRVDLLDQERATLLFGDLTPFDSSIKKEK